jgi:hypothetical protein
MAKYSINPIYILPPLLSTSSLTALMAVEIELRMKRQTCQPSQASERISKRFAVPKFWLVQENMPGERLTQARRAGRRNFEITGPPRTWATIYYP